MTYKLKNWSIVGYPGDEYRAPEARTVHFQGIVVEREGFEVGGALRTSPVVGAEGKVVSTRSGSEYEMVGEPDPMWISWLADQGKEPDPHNILLVRDKAEVV